MVYTTGKNQCEAADKRVRSLIFCARTSGMPYALDDAVFSSATGSFFVFFVTSDAKVLSQ